MWNFGSEMATSHRPDSASANAMHDIAVRRVRWSYNNEAAGKSNGKPQGNNGAPSLRSVKLQTGTVKAVKLIAAGIPYIANSLSKSCT